MCGGKKVGWHTELTKFHIPRVDFQIFLFDLQLLANNLLNIDLPSEVFILCLFEVVG